MSKKSSKLSLNFLESAKSPLFDDELIFSWLLFNHGTSAINMVFSTKFASLVTGKLLCCGHS